jgi:hypothetical protein
VFQVLGVDRIGSAALVEALLASDDAIWNEWRGPKDDRPPHKLTLPGRVVRRWNGEGLDLIARGLRSDNVRVF